MAEARAVSPGAAEVEETRETRLDFELARFRMIAVGGKLLPDETAR